MKFELFEPGLVFESEHRVITREEIVDYSRRYDAQAVHLDREQAVATGHADVIAPGFLILSIAWELWLGTGAIGEDGRGGVGLTGVRWLRPLHPDTSVRVRATVVEARLTSKGKGLVRTDVSLLDDFEEELACFGALSLIAREGDGPQA